MIQIQVRRRSEFGCPSRARYHVAHGAAAPPPPKKKSNKPFLSDRLSSYDMHTKFDVDTNLNSTSTPAWRAQLRPSTHLLDAPRTSFVVYVLRVNNFLTIINLRSSALGAFVVA